MDKRGERGGGRAGMLLGGGLVLIGVVVGAGTFGGSSGKALAAGSADASIALPAITVGSNEFALVKEAGGRYFIIDHRGTARPVRVKDLDLTRTVPGSSIVFAP